MEIQEQSPGYFSLMKNEHNPHPHVGAKNGARIKLYRRAFMEKKLVRKIALFEGL